MADERYPNVCHDLQNSSYSFNGQEYINHWSIDGCLPDSLSIDGSKSWKAMQSFQDIEMFPDLESSPIEFCDFTDNTFSSCYPYNFRDMDLPRDHSVSQAEIYPGISDVCPPNKSSLEWEPVKSLQNMGMHSKLIPSPKMQYFTPCTDLESDNYLLCKKISNDVEEGVKNRSIGIIENETGARNKNPNMIKGHWNKEEDMVLENLVQQFGTKNWPKIAKLMQTRTTKQCRERWDNNLKPDIKNDNWTVEEDVIIIEAHKKIGTKWREIAKGLPGRTKNSIKNRWNAAKRRRGHRSSKYPQSSTLLFDYVKSLPQNACIIPTTTISTVNNNNILNISNLSLEKKVLQPVVPDAKTITEPEEDWIFSMSDEDFKSDLYQAIKNIAMPTYDWDVLRDYLLRPTSEIDNMKVLPIVPETLMTTMESRDNQMFLINQKDYNNCINHTTNNIGMPMDN